jgi:integrase
MKTEFKLDTREARKKLAPEDAPYYRDVAKRVAVGYRKGIKTSTWSVRLFSGGKYQRQELGQADDTLPSNGVSVLSWSEALTKALATAMAKPAEAEAMRKRHTVKQCVEDYFANRRARSRSPESVSVDGYKIASFLERFGNEQVSALSMSALQRWRDALVASPDAEAELSDTDRRAQQRAAQATANRMWSTCRAALNFAFNSGRVQSDLEWRRIKPFRGTDAPRKRFLSVAECNKLLGASPVVFRNLAQAALLTGLRPSELVRLDVSMIEKTLMAVGQGKGNTGRHVPLTKAGQTFFKKLAKGRGAADILLPNAAGGRWTRMQIARAMRQAVKESSIQNPAVFYDLRRTYGSLLANAGAADTIIAHSLGHADTRMTRRHYAHLLDATVAAELEARLPAFKATRRAAANP